MIQILEIPALTEWEYEIQMMIVREALENGKNIIEALTEAGF